MTTAEIFSQHQKCLMMVILCIDGWQCTGQNSRSVANWIRKKPKDDEQVLVLQGSKHDDAIDEKSV